jgi:hypothetical protein
MVTDFCANVRQALLAICMYLASRCSSASRLSALPEHVTKRGAEAEARYYEQLNELTMVA